MLLLYSRHISLQKQLEMAVTLFQLSLLGKTIPALWTELSPLNQYSMKVYQREE